MPYVRRKPDGTIVSLHVDRTLEATEYIDSRHADIESFLGRDKADPNDFSRLDAEFVRVIEDVIDTLIVKNILNITDLPAEAQAKLFARKSFRERVTRHALKLFGDSGFSEVIDDTNFGDLR